MSASPGRCDGTRNRSPHAVAYLSDVAAIITVPAGWNAS